MTMFHFFCSQCGQQLQTDDSYVGQSIECPYCKKTVAIPENKAVFGKTGPVPPNAPVPDSNVFDVAGEAPLPSSNPYETPVNYQTPMTPYGGEAIDGMVPVKVPIADLLTNTGKLLWRYAGQFLLIGLAFFLMNIALNAILTPLGSGLTLFENTAMNNPGNYGMMSIIVLALVMLIPLVLSIMFCNYTINLTRTGNADFTNLLPKNGWAFGGTFLATICFFFICFLFAFIPVIALGVIVVGMNVLQTMFAENMSETALLISRVGIVIVGVVLFVMGLIYYIKKIIHNSFYMQFIIDKNVGVGEAFTLSQKFVSGNVLALIVTCIIFNAPVAIISGVLNVSMQATTFHPEASKTVLYIIPVVIQALNSFISLPIYMAILVNMYFLMTGQASIFRGHFSQTMFQGPPMQGTQNIPGMPEQSAPYPPVDNANQQ